MYTHILFDLDGTISDPGPGITKSVQYALRAEGIEVKDPKVLEKFIGPPLVDSFMEFYGFDGSSVRCGRWKSTESVSQRWECMKIRYTRACGNF